MSAGSQLGESTDPYFSLIKKSWCKFILQKRKYLAHILARLVNKSLKWLTPIAPCKLNEQHFLASLKNPLQTLGILWRMKYGPTKPWLASEVLAQEARPRLFSPIKQLGPKRGECLVSACLFEMCLGCNCQAGRLQVGRGREKRCAQVKPKK